jgi:hypothetical protein
MEQLWKDGLGADPLMQAAEGSLNVVFACDLKRCGSVETYAFQFFDYCWNTDNPLP